MKRIMIVDENQENLQYLTDASYFAFRNAQVVQFSSLIGIEKTLEHNQYNLIMLGINSPDHKKQKSIKKIRQLQTNAMIVVVSKFEQQQEIFSTLRLGADGYILKSESYANLIKILRESESGIPPMSPVVTRKVILSFRHQAPVPVDKKLTQRENEVLQQLSKGLSNKSIANELGISAYTVADHIKSMFAKLNVKTRAAIIAHALPVRGKNQHSQVS